MLRTSEGPDDGLVLLTVQVADEVLDGLGTVVKLLLALQQLRPLIAEVDVLVEGLLVDVAVLLELLVAIMQLLVKLLDAVALV